MNINPHISPLLHAPAPSHSDALGHPSLPLFFQPHAATFHTNTCVIPPGHLHHTNPPTPLPRFLSSVATTLPTKTVGLIATAVAAEGCRALRSASRPWGQCRAMSDTLT